MSQGIRFQDHVDEYFGEEETLILFGDKTIGTIYNTCGPWILSFIGENTTFSFETKEEAMKQIIPCLRDCLPSVIKQAKAVLVMVEDLYQVVLSQKDHTV